MFHDSNSCYLPACESFQHSWVESNSFNNARQWCNQSLQQQSQHDGKLATLLFIPIRSYNKNFKVKLHVFPVKKCLFVCVCVCVSVCVFSITIK